MSTSFAGRDPSTGRQVMITCADGHITGISPCAADDDCWIAPGLIDLQVNGYRGDDFNADDLTIETVQRLAHRMLANAVTTFFPTLITASEEKIIHNLRVIAAARQADPLVRKMIHRVHIEGPHISPLDGPRGAHPVEHVRPPDLAEFARWQRASGNLAGMITLSPHYSHSPAYIHALSVQGIPTAIGHSNATVEQIYAAVNAGARLSTHLGNGIAELLPRHPNLLWTQLAEDRLTATLICDGHHLPIDTLTVMLRAKTVERAILVSDVVMLAGLPPGAYQTPVGGRVELHLDGRLNIAGSDSLAGSTCLLKDAVAFVAGRTGFPLADALQMATKNPGRFAGNAGTLRIGAPADLIRFRWEPGSMNLFIEQVVLNGEAVPAATRE